MGDDSKPTIAAKRSSREPAPEPAVPEGPRASTRYTEGDEIARGGMGRVVEAVDTMLGRTVAVKQVLSTDPELLRRFARETRITARLEHPSIVPVYDAGTSPDGTPFYVMRKVTGRPLEQVVDGAKTLADRLALVPHVLAAAQAVAHAHARGVVHRDIKPTNILVGELGETVVIDWGLAKVIGEPDDPVGRASVPADDAGDSLHTRIGVVFGTPGFMPPEQVAGDPVDERCDVYALGATLYHVLSREVPHQGDSGTAMMGAALAGPPRRLDELVAGVPPELTTIVDTALAHDRGARYANAGALAADLQRFLTGQLVASHRYSRAQHVARFVRKHRLPLAIAALAVAALVTGGILAFTRVSDARDVAAAQAALATTRQLEAESARARESERADQLMLVQARTLVDTNPTGAVALLKQLRSPPERWDRLWRNARGIAAGARANGVARSMIGPTLTLFMTYSPSGDRLVAFGRDRSVWEYDLVHQTGRQLVVLPEEYDAVRYIDETHLVAWGVVTATSSIAIVSRDTGAIMRSAKLPIGISMGVVVRGSTLVITDRANHVSRIDLETFAVTPIPMVIAATHVTASYTGGAIAIHGDIGFGILDTTTFAMEVIDPTLEMRALSWAYDETKIALTTSSKFGIYDLKTKATRWWPAPLQPLTAAISENKLVAFDISGVMRISMGDKLEPRFNDPLEISLGLHPTASGMLVAASGKRVLLVRGSSTIALPAPVEGFHRLTATPGSSYIVGARAGRIYTWNLSEIYPETPVIPDVANFKFVGVHDVVVSQDGDWFWIQPDTKATHRIQATLSPLAQLHTTADPTVAVALADLDGGAMFGAHIDGTVDKIADDAMLGERTADGTYYVIRRDGSLDGVDPVTHRMTRVFTRAGGSIHSFAWSNAAIALLYEDGFAWRRETNGRETTTTLPQTTLPHTFVINVDVTGSVFIPSKDRILRWELDGGMHELVKLPDEIVGVLFNSSLMIASTRDGAGWVLGHDGVLASRIPSGVIGMHMAEETSIAMYLDAMHDIRLVDLVAGETWRLLPDDGDHVSMAAISSDAKLIGGVVARGGLHLWRVRIPTDEAATASWLDELTNATAEAGDAALAWR